MATVIAQRTHELLTFVSVDSGTKFVTLSAFNTRFHGPDIAREYELTPDEARQLAGELVRRANEIDKAMGVEVPNG